MKRFHLWCLPFFVISITASAWAINANPTSNYVQRLDEYMDIIQRSKKLLDDPETQATPKQQQQALCERLKAYRDIVKLTEIYPEEESAPSMRMAAKMYLTQQQQSLEKTGMNQENYCATTP